jgi:hypothetical protein
MIIYGYICPEIASSEQLCGNATILFEIYKAKILLTECLTGYSIACGVMFKSKEQEHPSIANKVK